MEFQLLTKIKVQKADDPNERDEHTVLWDRNGARLMVCFDRRAFCGNLLEDVVRPSFQCLNNGSYPAWDSDEGEHCIVELNYELSVLARAPDNLRCVSDLSEQEIEHNVRSLAQEVFRRVALIEGAKTLELPQERPVEKTQFEKPAREVGFWGRLRKRMVRNLS